MRWYIVNLLNFCTCILALKTFVSTLLNLVKIFIYTIAIETRIEERDYKMCLIITVKTPTLSLMLTILEAEDPYSS